MVGKQKVSELYSNCCLRTNFYSTRSHLFSYSFPFMSLALLQLFIHEKDKFVCTGIFGGISIERTSAHDCLHWCEMQTKVYFIVSSQCKQKKAMDKIGKKEKKKDDEPLGVRTRFQLRKSWVRMWSGCGFCVITFSISTI